VDTGRRQSGRLAGIGVLVFGVLALIATWWWLKPGGHPLAGVIAWPLCEDVAAAWDGPFDAVAFRPPEQSGSPDGQVRIECRVTMASTPEMLVGLQTTATLRRAGGLGPDTTRLIETWVAESRASGQQAEAVDGPWRQGWLISGGSGASVLIAEDRGVVVTVIAPELEPQRLVAPGRELAERLRR